MTESSPMVCRVLLLLLILFLRATPARSSPQDYCEAFLEEHKHPPLLRSPGRQLKEEVLYDGNIQLAVDQWLTNRSGAISRFGHISSWDVKGISYMKNLFKGATNFNDNISGWDTGCVGKERT